jgi:transposase InsO family protein
MSRTSNIAGTFYYLCSLLDGCSRFTVHWEIRESMTEADVEQIIQRAREKFPGVTSRIISDNGPQFIARDFKEFIRLCGMTHVKTSPYCPQSNGKIERWHRILKEECIRPGTPLTLENARRIVGKFVEYYNTVSLIPTPARRPLPLCRSSSALQERNRPTNYLSSTFHLGLTAKQSATRGSRGEYRER